MKLLVPLVLALSFFLTIASGFAQDEAKLLQDAVTLLTEGKVEEAQDLVKRAYLVLWNKAPLTCPTYLFVEEEPRSFAVYRPRPSQTFIGDEVMYVYAEPKNYTILQEGDVYHTYLAVGYAVYDKGGNYLGGEESWEEFRYITKAPVFELFFSFSFSFNLDPGDYVLEVTVKDKLSDKETSFRLPFKRL
ncbi:hypothetical protein [Candidatus Caldatribacterium sp.]|uniref:hypothetical protein n=1 Tax=Candidatus Caldatribacterium sp. TaxID=2282143 RepID=UPI002998CAEF|nr:hypothetical protein [Candidatus Caldatribacterium sp.]MDW8081848.1 hypothetical protein [Candidatus Calescibacterium sp.]